MFSILIIQPSWNLKSLRAKARKKPNVLRTIILFCGRSNWKKIKIAYLRVQTLKNNNLQEKFIVCQVVCFGGLGNE